MNTPITFEPVSEETVRIRALDQKQTPVRAKHILVVDDDELFLTVAATALRQAGYQVETAGDGEAGWTALCAGTYDLLITDNDMPRLTGVQLVMRTREAGMSLPVVMASGSSVLDALQGSGGLDLAAFLHKPFAIHELVDVAASMASPRAQPLMEYINPQSSAAFFFPASERWGWNE